MFVLPSTLTFQCMPIAIDADKTAGAADNFRRASLLISLLRENVAGRMSQVTKYAKRSPRTAPDGA
jgi:hypothetical protein